MSKKKHKKEKKKDIYHIQCDELANELLKQYAEPTMHVRLGYEGKLYEGNIPCVGVVE